MKHGYLHAKNGFFTYLIITLALYSSNRTDVLYFSEAAAIMKDIVDAIAYLHSQGIAHRDVKVCILINEKLLSRMNLTAIHYRFTLQPEAHPTIVVF